MKLKKITLILLLLLLNITYSQTIDQGIITYKASINFDNEYYEKAKELKNTSDDIKKKIISSLKKSKSLNYILLFQDKESLFSKEKTLKNESEKGFSIVEILAGKGVYYTNRSTLEIIEQKESFGQKFLVNRKPMKWILTKEKKVVGKYNCYKATASVIIENSSGTSNKEIIAWYTPEIPLSFGPKKYNGLPGLILELFEGKFSFKAVQIELNPNKKIVINKPTKGKKITEEELNKISKKMVEERRSNKN